MATITVRSDPSAKQLETQPAKKKKKLTKEEKLDLKKKKRELQKQKALTEKKQQFRDYLDRELMYTEKTYKRAAADWEAMCSGIKLRELQDEMTELWQSVNRTLDAKNYKLRLLMQDLDTTEEQYRRNFSKHVDIIEYLLKLYKLFIAITKSAYEKDASDLVADFEEDLAQKNEIHANRRKYYENILHATNLITREVLKSLENRFNIDKNELIDTHAAKRMQYRDDTVCKMEQLQSHMKNIIEDLQCDALKPKREQLYNAYVKQQEQVTKESQTFQEASKRLLSTISGQQKKLSTFESEKNTEIIKLRGERSYFVEHYWHLKEINKNSNRSKAVHLRQLAFESNKVITELKQILKYGELLLGVAAVCRKSQTEQEKVMPWSNRMEDYIPENFKLTEELNGLVRPVVERIVQIPELPAIHL